MTDEPFAVTLPAQSSLAQHTGAWRTERPVFVTRLPPCNDACPAGENVQQWLFHAEEGGYEAAWRQLVADNPLPAVMGRICYHPCQDACNRAQLDEVAGIHAVERFLGDLAIERGWRLPPPGAPTGKHVLVVGSGPGGLAGAYHLRRRGHDVTIREAQPELGGMMRYGIPAYRLPRDVLDAELARILALGVQVQAGSRIEDLAAVIETDGYDAVLLAVGAQAGRHAEIPAGDAGRVLDALSLLHAASERASVLLGQRVVVYGGGNTAMDAARTARRLGASDALVVYRRTRQRMPAHPEEVEEALAEGVRMKWLSTITAVAGQQLTVERMQLDEHGFPRPTGEFEALDADDVVLALGQDTDLSLLAGLPDVRVADGVVAVGGDGATGHPGVFAGGDVASTERTATSAVGQGKHAARAIDAYLLGIETQPPPRPALASADRLNLWYYADAPAAVQPRLAAARRLSTFDEVVHGLDEATALYEARRCLSCGNCLQCDNCYGVCPDNAVRKHPDGTYSVDLDYCKGCGLCAAECPCGAIDMLPEWS